MSRQFIGLHAPTHLPQGSDPLIFGMELGWWYGLIIGSDPATPLNPPIPSGTTLSAQIASEIQTDFCRNGPNNPTEPTYIKLAPGLYLIKCITYWHSDPTGMSVQIVRRDTVAGGGVKTAALEYGDEWPVGGGGLGLSPFNPLQVSGTDTFLGKPIISTECLLYVDSGGYDFGTHTPMAQFGVDLVNGSAGTLALYDDGPTAFGSALIIVRAGIAPEDPQSSI